MQTVVLSSEKYDQFIRCLMIFRDLSNDIDIRGGVIRQRTNDKSCIFEVNLIPILSDLSFPVEALKKRMDLLKMFSGQEVSISVEDNNYVISDQYSKVRFELPDRRFLDNMFIPEEELNNIFNIVDEDIILQYTVTKRISDRLRIVAQAFDSNTLRLSLNGETAKITTRTQSGGQSATFAENIPTEKQISAETNIVIGSFIFDHDEDLTFKLLHMLKDGEPSNIVLTQTSAAIDDLNIRVLTRSTLLEEEVEETVF